jgi:DMSO/TMAO reductase YedYZ molybdopterin-dependent catalytic subunit
MTLLTRRALLGSSLAAAGTGAIVTSAPAARAGAPAIVKPLPPEWFVDFGTNAEMRWDSVDPRARLTPQERLFVRNHTVTPSLTRESYALEVYGGGLATPRAAADAVRLSFAQLRAMPSTTIEAAHECTGNGRSFFASQQGQQVSGTAWTLGAVGTVRWEGVRLAEVLRRVGVSPEAVSVQAAGLDPSYVSGGVDHGRVRRPFPISKALDDALLAWGMNGEELLPDHGFPLRLVLPGWVGIASIKWLGSLEVAARELTSPWNTTWYTMTGGGYPADSPPLTLNPVRSAWELPWGAELRAGRPVRLTGRSWSGAGDIRRVDVSVDGGRHWRRAVVERPGRGLGWSQWSLTAVLPRGAHVLQARAADALGRTQPLETPYNSNGYFFDAVVRHPVIAR